MSFIFISLSTKPTAKRQSILRVVKVCFLNELNSQSVRILVFRDSQRLTRAVKPRVQKPDRIPVQISSKLQNSTKESLCVGVFRINLKDCTLTT